ncbi:MAG: hypothetical protein KAS32_26785, partial [Candidatus Peribacteraceae bacterium]|nr:hypothetical protein [Candidatus Peribacteraceae bacterium]
LFIMGEVCVRNAIENRLPFRDNDLVDFALTIPLEMRCKSRIYFKFLKRVVPDLSKINTSSGFKISKGLTTNNILHAKRYANKKLRNALKILSFGLLNFRIRGDYPDYGEWLRENSRLRKWAEGILLSEKSLKHGYFNKKNVRSILECHMNKKKDYTGLIFTLLAFEIWYKMFMEGGDING